jgi:hypothetical protein
VCAENRAAASCHRAEISGFHPSDDTARYGEYGGRNQCRPRLGISSEWRRKTAEHEFMRRSRTVPVFIR